MTTTVDGSSRRVSVGALMAALLVACMAFQLNASMLSPALKTMETQLNTTEAGIGMTQTAFFTSAAVFSLFLPRLGDLIGRKKVLTGMLLLMAIGCVVAALANSVAMLFVGRVIQGISGPTVPLCLVMLRHEVREPKLYGTLMGIVTAVNGGIAGVDAIAGGWLATNHGFASVFWAMTGVAILAALLVAVLAPESSDPGDTTRMDWLGVVLLVVAIGSLLVALNDMGKLAAANWVLVAVLIVVSVVFLVAFWRVETRESRPLVRPEDMRQRSTWALLITTVLTMTGVFAVMNGLVPNLAQDKSVGLGMSAESAAYWTLTPYAIAGLLMGPLSGRLASTMGYKTILRLGMIGTVIGVLVLAFTSASTSSVLLLVLSIFIGLTYAGTVNIMLNGLGVVLSPKQAPGMLPGLNAGAFNLGAGLSFAVLFAVATAFGPQEGSQSASGYVTGMLAGAVILGLALLTSFLIPRPTEAEAGAEALIDAPSGGGH